MVDGVVLLVDAAEGPAAADPFRPAQGLRTRPAADRRDQQDRPRRRARPGGAERGLRPVHRPRRDRGADRFPGALHHGRKPAPASTSSDVPGERPASRCSSRSSPTCRRSRRRPEHAAADAGLQPRLPATTWAASPSAASSTAGSKLGSPVVVCKVDGKYKQDQGHQAVRLRGPEAGRDRRGRAGDIVCLAGIEDITIGETIADPEKPKPIAADGRRRADRVDGVRRQHLADGRPRRHST